ncbi:hypothetical protein D3C75_885330 [compost metagenome]
MVFLLCVVPAEIEIKTEQDDRHGEPLHGISDVFFRAHGDYGPVGLIGGGAGFGPQLVGKAFAIQCCPELVWLNGRNQLRPCQRCGICVQLERRPRGDVDPRVKAYRLGGCLELRWCAALRPRQPAAIDQQPKPGGLIVKGLQQLDANPAVALTVIQQQAVFGIELAVQVNPTEGRVCRVLQFGAGHRLGGPPLGVALQQHAFLRAPAQLPEPQGHQ